jgi:preprotein translocase subunit SecB
MTNGNGNGGAAQTPPQAQAVAPQINIFAQYTKDLSFENPHAPRSLAPGGQQPEISIQVNVSANPMQDGNVEVVLKIDGKAETKADASGTVLFNFELTYAGIFRIQNVPQENFHPVVMIECPRLLFPFAREIIATAVTNGGFPPLLLDPIDFVNLYRQNLAQSQAAPPPTAQA